MVKCEICNKNFRIVTNTHLKTHGYTSEQYETKFPNSLRFSEEILKERSQIMMGKNVGRERPDSRERMNNRNPMKDGDIANKMGITRKKRIGNGSIDAMINFNHLPTPYEKQLIVWFKEWNIPLMYVGDGQKLIEGFCPDFINEDKKIILELELNFAHRPRNTISDKENAYTKAGYRTIWITELEKEYIKKMTNCFFKSALKPTKIKRIWVEPINPKSRKKVYNMEVVPNNTYVANNIVVHNCFANAFRASLYTAFFDNSKTIGMRHCNSDYYKKELGKLFNKYRGKNPLDITSDIGKAVAKEMPIRFGIRFEDFLPIEKQKGISLALLKFLSEENYPLMINTKSALVAEDAYLEALISNPAKTAVHVTLISSNNAILKNLEPGAPSYEDRLEALKILSANGIRTVARIEPFLPFYADKPEEVQKYIADMKSAGVKNLTLDTYSYTAQNPGIRSDFIKHGVDFERLFTLTAESQAVGSLLLGAFMDIFREEGFSCSTFDMGNVPNNDQHVCCEVSDWFNPESFNFGCSVYAARYIRESKTPVSWGMYEAYVNEHGGFLNDTLRKEVWELWNCGGNDAYSHSWAQGMEAVGNDANGIIWEYKKENDFRKIIVKGASNNENFL